MEKRFAIGLCLVILGVVMVTLTFYLAIQAFETYPRVEVKGTSIVEALTSSAGLILDVLFRLAFLGIALAAGATCLRYGVQILIKPE